MPSGEHVDFRGLLRKTSGHVADDVYPHRAQEMAPEDDEEDWEVFDIPAFEEEDFLEGSQEITTAAPYGRTKGLLKQSRSFENRRTQRRSLAWASEFEVREYEKDEKSPPASPCMGWSSPPNKYMHIGGDGFAGYNRDPYARDPYAFHDPHGFHQNPYPSQRLFAPLLLRPRESQYDMYRRGSSSGPKSGPPIERQLANVHEDDRSGDGSRNEDEQLQRSEPAGVQRSPARRPLLSKSSPVHSPGGPMNVAGKQSEESPKDTGRIQRSERMHAQRGAAPTRVSPTSSPVLTPSSQPTTSQPPSLLRPQVDRSQEQENIKCAHASLVEERELRLAQEKSVMREIERNLGFEQSSPRRIRTSTNAMSSENLASTSPRAKISSVEFSQQSTTARDQVPDSPQIEGVVQYLHPTARRKKESPNEKQFLPRSALSRQETSNSSQPLRRLASQNGQGPTQLPQACALTSFEGYNAVTEAELKSQISNTVDEDETINSPGKPIVVRRKRPTKSAQAQAFPACTPAPSADPGTPLHVIGAETETAIAESATAESAQARVSLESHMERFLGQLEATRKVAGQNLRQSDGAGMGISKYELKPKHLGANEDSAGKEQSALDEAAAWITKQAEEVSKAKRQMEEWKLERRRQEQESRAKSEAMDMLLSRARAAAEAERKRREEVEAQYRLEEEIAKKRRDNELRARLEAVERVAMAGEEWRVRQQQENERREAEHVALAEEARQAEIMHQESLWQLELDRKRARQEEALEAEREEAILAAAREDLAKLVGTSMSDDDDEMWQEDMLPSSLPVEWKPDTQSLDTDIVKPGWISLNENTPVDDTVDLQRPTIAKGTRNAQRSAAPRLLYSKSVGAKEHTQHDSTVYKASADAVPTLLPVIRRESAAARRAKESAIHNGKSVVPVEIPEMPLEKLRAQWLAEADVRPGAEQGAVEPREATKRKDDTSFVALDTNVAEVANEEDEGKKCAPVAAEEQKRWMVADDVAIKKGEEDKAACVSAGMQSTGAEASSSNASATTAEIRITPEQDLNGRKKSEATLRSNACGPQHLAVPCATLQPTTLPGLIPAPQYNHDNSDVDIKLHLFYSYLNPTKQRHVAAVLRKYRVLEPGGGNISGLNAELRSKYDLDLDASLQEIQQRAERLAHKVSGGSTFNPLRSAVDVPFEGTALRPNVQSLGSSFSGVDVEALESYAGYQQIELRPSVNAHVSNIHEFPPKGCDVLRHQDGVRAQSRHITSLRSVRSEIMSADVKSPGNMPAAYGYSSSPAAISSKHQRQDAEKSLANMEDVLEKFTMSMNSSTPPRQAVTAKSEVSEL